MGNQSRTEVGERLGGGERGCWEGRRGKENERGGDM